MHFSLIHASRGRIARAGDAIDEWLSHASGRHQYEYILSVDEDDPDRPAYAALAAQRGVRLVVHRNRSNTEATNHAARLARGDVFLAIADDFGCPADWDLAVEAAIGGRRDVAVLVNDGIDGRIMTLPIIDRAFYERNGHVYYPAYLTMYSDDDLTEQARFTGRLIDARHLTFPHRHWTTGTVPQDAIYARQNRPLAWMVGRYVFEKRRATKFGTAPRTLTLMIRLLAINIRATVVITGSRVKRRVLRRPPL